MNAKTHRQRNNRKAAVLRTAMQPYLEQGMTFAEALQAVRQAAATK